MGRAMPKPPPRDQNGKIVPHDHADILDEHYVIRHTTPHDLSEDDGGIRLTSGAFSESEGGGMSVDIEDWMKADGLDPTHYVTDPTHGAVRLKVGDLRRQNLKVGWDPDDAHPHHGSVWGIGNGSKRKRRVLEIATSLKRVEGETLPIPRRTAAAQAQSETALARAGVVPLAQVGMGASLETIAIWAEDGTIALYDMYVVRETDRTWIGSRRTLAQCDAAFEAYCRHKFGRK
jgi:hypothetical protein